MHTQAVLSEPRRHRRGPRQSSDISLLRGSSSGQDFSEMQCVYTLLVEHAQSARAILLRFLLPVRVVSRVKLESCVS